ncbi:MAG: hypothetical protein HY433_01590 [Candidatus Liptonbacteria bacterium]|nr:hypothetical protein [Candidatus Liptonbacteria bacterium]
MLNFFHDIAQKSAAVLTALLATGFGFIAQPNIVVITPPVPISVLPALPEISVMSPTSTELARQISTATASATTSTSTKTATSSSSSSTKKEKTAETAKIPETKPLPAPKVFTAQLLLDSTGFSLGQRTDGAYRLLLHTTTTANSGFNWDLSETTIGGAAPIPKLEVSFSCDPQPDIPPSGSPDQNPTFSIGTSYACVISLTDALLRKQNKQINFQTGAGRLVVKASNLDTTLKFNKSTNGFVLDNQSNAPVTVTGLAFDMSFTALNTSSPIVLRFLEPENESTLAEYPLQNLPTDSSRPYTRKGADTKASFSFTVKPRGQRLLMIQVLGVQPLASVGVNPEVTVVLQEVTTDHPEIKTALLSSVISWSCIPYNPNQSAQGLPTEQNCK